jgi:putative transposase
VPAGERRLGLRGRLDGFIGVPDAPDIADLLHAHAGTGRPLGPDSWIEALEQRLKRPLKRQQPGPKPPQRDSPHQGPL